MSKFKTNIKVIDYEAAASVSASPLLDISYETLLGFQNNDNTTTLALWGSLDKENWSVVYRVTASTSIATPPLYATYIFDRFTFPCVNYVKFVKATPGTIKVSLLTQ